LAFFVPDVIYGCDTVQRLDEMFISFVATADWRSSGTPSDLQKDFKEKGLHLKGKLSKLSWVERRRRKRAEPNISSRSMPRLYHIIRKIRRICSNCVVAKNIMPQRKAESNGEIK